METPPRPRLLERLGLHRPELRAWAMYDWANSAMMTVVVTAVFPVWYEKGVAQGDPDAVGDFSLATTIAMACAAVLGPLLGVLGDLAPIKKRLLLTFQLVAVAATALLSLAGPGDAGFALWMFAIANVGATAAFVFYDALLPHIAREDEMDQVSTAGYALGYVGGGIALGAVLAAILAHESLGIADRGTATRYGFLLTAVWWVVFSVPLFRRVPEPPVRLEAGESAGPIGIRSTFRRLGETVRELRRHRDAFTMMVAFLLYNDGIGAIIRLAGIVGAERKFSETTILGAILAVQFVGIPFAFGFGRLAARIGAKRSIFLALGVYVGVTLLASRMSTEFEFWLLAILVGAVQGGAQALSRSLFAAMSPRHKSSEFFGLFGVFEKFAGVLGPALFTVVHRMTHDSGLAALTILPFFAVGALLLTRVNVDRGRAAARASEEATVALQPAAAG